VTVQYPDRRVHQAILSVFERFAAIGSARQVLMESTNGRADPRPSPELITWDQFERNQKILAENNFMRTGTGRKAGRGGQGLLTGLLRCRRCGREALRSVVSDVPEMHLN
jgi:hypothetical protein